MIFRYKEREIKDLGKGVKRSVLSFDDNMMSVEVYFEEGAVGELHQHIHDQISIVKSGTFEYEENGIKTILYEGDSYYVKGGILHGVKALTKGILIDIFTPMRKEFLE